ncbi:hypothetical protein Dimus_007803 [Dionaea muscipula]
MVALENSCCVGVGKNKTPLSHGNPEQDKELATTQQYLTANWEHYGNPEETEAMTKESRVARESHRFCYELEEEDMLAWFLDSCSRKDDFYLSLWRNLEGKERDEW